MTKEQAKKLIDKPVVYYDRRNRCKEAMILKAYRIDKATGREYCVLKDRYQESYIKAEPQFVLNGVNDSERIQD